MSNSYRESAFARWLFIALAVVSVFVFWRVGVTFFLAATIAAVAHPLKERIRHLFRKPDLPRANLAASILVLLLLAVIVATVLAAFVLLFLLQADTLKAFAISVSQRVSKWLAELLPRQPALTEYAAKAISTAASYLYPIITGAGAAIIHAALFFIAILAFLLHGKEILASLIALLPHHKKTLEKLLTRAHDTLYAIYFVHLLTAAATFLLAIPFFAALSFKPLLFWAVLCALFQLIPFLGPTIIMLSLAIWCFVTARTTDGVLMLAVGYPLVCAFPDIVLRPLLMGRHAKTNTLLLWLGFLGGLLSMGPVGFVAGPLLLSLLAHVLAEYARQTSSIRPK